MKIDRDTNDLLLIQEALNEAECEFLIDLLESVDLPPNCATSPFGIARPLSAGIVDECSLFNNHQFTHLLWTRLAKHLPKDLGYSNAVGLNERLRFRRFRPGQSRPSHVDIPFLRSPVESSSFSLVIYLNDDFDGGALRIGHVSVSPRRGMAVAFRHHIKHEEETVFKGVKYILRTDIMYRLKGR